jgi:hypothetical protein
MQITVFTHFYIDARLVAKFPFLHFTIVEASVDTIVGMALQTRFSSATGKDDGLLQKETTDMENCHHKIEFFFEKTF